MKLSSFFLFVALGCSSRPVDKPASVAVARDALPVPAVADAVPAADAAPAPADAALAADAAPKFGKHGDHCFSPRTNKKLLDCDRGLECCRPPSGVQLPVETPHVCLTHAQCMLSPP